MSQENVGLVRQLVGAFNRRDLTAMSEMFDPEIDQQFAVHFQIDGSRFVRMHGLPAWGVALEAAGLSE